MPQNTPFNPNDHVIQLKSREGSKDYLPVQYRLVWFREKCPNGTIETEMIHLDLDRVTEEETYVWSNEKRRSEKVTKTALGIAIFKATVKDGNGGVATGTKSEKAASFPDYIEKAETGAIGRALTALGYGTQFAPELSEEHRIVDSPVERQSAQVNGQSVGTSSREAVAAKDADAEVTDQQLSSIRKLHEYLGKAEPEGVASISQFEASQLIRRLSVEYNTAKKAAQNGKAS